MISQWVNIEDEGAPHALLRRIENRIAISRIDALWIFPVRRAAGFESSVFVVSSFEPGDETRRRVNAVRFLVARDRKGRATVQEQFYDFALAPAETLNRVVDGVMRRLGEDAAEAPRSHSIDGSAEPWADLLRRLGAPGTTQVAPAPDPSAAALPSD